MPVENLISERLYGIHGASRSRLSLSGYFNSIVDRIYGAGTLNARSIRLRVT